MVLEALSVRLFEASIHLFLEELVFGPEKALIQLPFAKSREAQSPFLLRLLRLAFRVRLTFIRLYIFFTVLNLLHVLVNLHILCIDERGQLRLLNCLFIRSFKCVHSYWDSRELELFYYIDVT